MLTEATDTPGALWYHVAQTGSTKQEAEDRDNSIVAKYLLNKLQPLGKLYSQFKIQKWLSSSSKPESYHLETTDEYSDLLPGYEGDGRSIEKRIMGNQRLILTRAAESIKNGLPNNSARLNTDLGKRSRSKSRKMDKRIVGNYHRQALASVADAINSELLDNPDRLNTDLGKRSRSNSRSDEYSDMSYFKREGTKMEKRLLGNYHRQALTSVVDAINSELLDNPDRLNTDLGKRSRSNSRSDEYSDMSYFKREGTKMEKRFLEIITDKPSQVWWMPLTVNYSTTRTESTPTLVKGQGQHQGRRVQQMTSLHN